MTKCEYSLSLTDNRSAESCYSPRMSRIVILTGAGISAESGIKTFRDQNGLWENHRVEDVASPEGFERDPNLVHRFYNERRKQLLETKPNPAHDALASFEKNWKGEFLLVTQNIDDLHERSGSKKMIHMHGELLKARCVRSGKVSACRTDINTETLCPCCERAGSLRPHIVWFGEIPFGMDQIEQELKNCQIFLSIGTSGNVYPAAGFVNRVPRTAQTIEINKDESMMSHAFQKHIRGAAGEVLPEFLNTIKL